MDRLHRGARGGFEGNDFHVAGFRGRDAGDTRRRRALEPVVKFVEGGLPALDAEIGTEARRRLRESKAATVGASVDQPCKQDFANVARQAIQRRARDGFCVLRPIRHDADRAEVSLAPLAKGADSRRHAKFRTEAARGLFVADADAVLAAGRQPSDKGLLMMEREEVERGCDAAFTHGEIG